MKPTYEPMSTKSPTLHLTVLLTVSIFVAIVSLAFTLELEVVARGQGKVVPLSRVQVVQPEFDGKIALIRTANGSVVRKGQVLIEFDASDSIADANTILAEMDRLAIERKRISVLISGIDNGTFDNSGTKKTIFGWFSSQKHTLKPFYAEQKQLLSAEIEELSAGLEQLDARLQANARSIAVTGANIERAEVALSTQRERFEVIQELLEKEITSRSRFLDAQEALTLREKERDVYLRELEQKRTQEAAIRAERRSLFASKRSALQSRSSEIEARLATLGEQLTIAKRRIDAAKLRAPMAGRVDQLDVYTIGAVVKSGDDILRVVPEGQAIEIEAQFGNSDIGFLSIGQQANIDFDAYPSERFGFIKGIVSDVAADSTEISEGTWVFVVKVTPGQNFLESGSVQYTLRPGMTASIDVTTDTRKLISYFFSPIIETVQSALGER